MEAVRARLAALPPVELDESAAHAVKVEREARDDALWRRAVAGTQTDS